MSPQMYHDAILSHWERANAADRTAARQWYPKAQRFARSLATRYDVSLEQSAAIIAWLSPSSPWEQNQYDAEQFLQVSGDIKRYKPATYLNNVRHAQNVLDGDVSFPSTAPKVSAFFACILDPWQSRRVTLDRWIARAHGIERLTPQWYTKLEHVYLSAARNVARPVAEVQALVWIQIRRELNA